MSLRKVRVRLFGLICLLLVVVLVAGCKVKPIKNNNNKDKDPVIIPLLFEETFDQITTLTNIKEDQSKLDNPNSFQAGHMSIDSVFAGREPGTLGLDNGDANSEGPNALRIAFTVPGLKEAVSPRLKLRIKNNSANLITLYVGNEFNTSGKLGENGHRAYYELDIPANTGYEEYEIELGTAYTHTELIQLRPTIIGEGGKATSNGAAGLYVDWIRVTDSGGTEEPVDYPPGTEPEPSTGPEPGEPPSELVDKFGVLGWAAVPTSTCPNGTTGGAGGEVNYVSTGDELQAAINKAMPKHGGKPQIIYVQGTITPSNTTNKQIDIKDVKNVSVIGVGTSALFDGIGINIVRAHNIIVQNVTVRYNRIGQKDGLCIQSEGSHIWIDHCEFYNSLDVHKDYYDELLSAKNKTEYITISWCYFHDSWKSILVGSGDGDDFDRKITFHHNLIENCNSRLPLFRFGTGHIFNNYYKNVLDTGINSRMGAKILIENNYFEKVHNPIGSWYSKEIGYWYQEGNIFDQCTKNKIYDHDVGPKVAVTDTTYQNTCEKLSLPSNYPYFLETAEEAKASVLLGAGVGKIGDPEDIPPGGGTLPGDGGGDNGGGDDDEGNGDDGGSSMPPGATGIVVDENFEGADAENFWTASYKHIPGDPTKAMYYAASDQLSKISFSNNQMTLAGGRFTIGQTDSTPTSSSDTVAYGSFDMSKNWKIEIRIVSGSGSGKFQVQVDNNTTSGGSSMHGSRSRIFSEAANSLGTTITITSEEKGQFTPNSFLLLRAESSATVVIDQILVETWD